MAEQTASNVMAAVKREVAGVRAAPGGGGLFLRLVDSPGLNASRTNIQSAERRIDGMAPMGRLGSRAVGGSYNTEISVGGYTDSFLEAGLRSIWVPPLTVDAANMGASTFSTTANTLVASSGSFVDVGLKIGDIVTITGDVTAANNDTRLRVINVVGQTVTFAPREGGDPLVVNGVQRALTLTRLKKVTTPLGVPPIRYSYTIEQYEREIDQSELFQRCRLTAFALSFRPNAIATATWTFMGLDREILVVGTAPWFTNPSSTSGLSLVADDSAIRFNGVDVAKFTALDINYAIEAAGQPVIGNIVGPDIYDNTATVTGSASMIREDFDKLRMFEAETEFELSLLLTEPGALPRPSLGLHMPRVKLTSAEAPFLGATGPKIETFNLMAAPHTGTSVIDASAINFFSTAP